MSRAERFNHDSELPPELCADWECEEHHPRCSWNGGECRNFGAHKVGGARWCGTHVRELRRQIKELRAVAK